MRQTHVAGERLFVDFAGQTVPITDPLTGTVRQAQIFVAAFGASNYTYAEARWSQGLADWIGCHVNTLTFFGRVTRQIVCDNGEAVWCSGRPVGKTILPWRSDARRS